VLLLDKSRLKSSNFKLILYLQTINYLLHWRNWKLPLKHLRNFKKNWTKKKRIKMVKSTRNQTNQRSLQQLSLRLLSKKNLCWNRHWHLRRMSQWRSSQTKTSKDFQIAISSNSRVKLTTTMHLSCNEILLFYGFSCLTCSRLLGYCSSRKTGNKRSNKSKRLWKCWILKSNSKKIKSAKKIMFFSFNFHYWQLQNII